MEFIVCFFFFKQKTAYEMRISDWSSDVCSSDLIRIAAQRATHQRAAAGGHAIVSDALPQGRRLEAARDAASQGPARHEGIVHISARREMRSELIVLVDTRAAGDDESVERPALVLDEQRPGFAGDRKSTRLNSSQ